MPLRELALGAADSFSRPVAAQDCKGDVGSRSMPVSHSSGTSGLETSSERASMATADSVLSSADTVDADNADAGNLEDRQQWP